MKVMKESSSLGTTYYCGECGIELNQLEEDGRAPTELSHDINEDLGTFKKNIQPIKCKNAGKRCVTPSIECLEL